MWVVITAEHCLSVDSLGRLETAWHRTHTAFLLDIFILNTEESGDC